MGLGIFLRYDGTEERFFSINFLHVPVQLHLPQLSVETGVENWVDAVIIR